MSALLFSLAVLGAQGGALGPVTGTWTRGDPDRGGGRLMAEQQGDTARFQLECWRGAPSHNTGFIEGSLVLEGRRGTFRREGASGQCELEFVFSEDAVAIEYLDDSTECGFGYRVYASGTYQRTSREPPTFCETDCRLG